MHSSTFVLVLLLRLVLECHGYSTFTIECSIPFNSINFVSSPDTRGTLNIVFSCLFSIFACTWSIQHLNVPEQRVVKRPAVDEGQENEAREEGKANQTADESRRDRAKTNGFWADFRWTLKGFWRNLKWMLFTVVAPEMIFGKALSDLVTALSVRERMKLLAEFDNVEWGLVHSFYANMGGFVGSEGNNDDRVQGTPLTAHQIYVLRITKAGTKDKLDVSDIIAGRAQFTTCLERLPNITAAEISDKSKGNVFVKAVTLFQVSWVVLQIVDRAAKGLSISLLELSVVAFSACSIVTYLLLLYKPQGVQIPIHIRLEPGSTIPDDSIFALRRLFAPGFGKDQLRERKIPNDVLHSIPDNFDDSTFALRRLFAPGFGEDQLRERKIPNDFLHSIPDNFGDAKSFHAAMLGFMLGGVIFGSIHIAGWNLAFPTHIERTLWRISSILVTVLLPANFFPITLMFNSSTFTENILGVFCYGQLRVLRVRSLVLGSLYVLARFFMLTEIIRTLSYLPPDSYIATWTSNIPHVS